MITHPEKVLFPDDGITKGELAAYYEAVASIMLPHIRGRPITMERYPSGIGQQGVHSEGRVEGIPGVARACRGAEEGRHGAPSRSSNDTRSLLWLANQNCITPHVWTSRVPDLYHPDICVFDLDPSKDDPDVLRARSARVARSARRARSAELGEDLRLEGLPHRRPARRQADFGAVARFRARRRARCSSSRDPKRLTQEFSKADRGGRILVDTGRNGYSATFAAAYAVRARAGAPVSAPCTWEEIEKGEVAPQTFTLRTIADRIDAVGDLWADMRKHRYSLRTKIKRIKAEETTRRSS